MTFYDRCAHLFFDQTRQRGSEYLSQGHVEMVTSNDHVILLNVFGGQTYTVTLSKELDGDSKCVMGSCSCPHYQSGNFCKHIWASLLYMEGHPFLEMSPRPTRLVAFHDHDYDDEDDEMDDPQDFEDIDGPEATSWQRNMKIFQKEMETQKTQRQRYIQTNGKYRELYYVLRMDEEKGHDDTYLNLCIFQCERGANGKFGKIKHFTTTWTNGILINHIPNGQDLRILSKYEANIEPLDDYGYYRSSNEARLRLPHDLALDALEEIASTGRLVTLDEGRRHNHRNFRPLTFIKESCTFQAKVGREGDHWILSGVFLRGSEEISHSVCDTVLRPVNFFVYDGVLSPFNTSPELDRFLSIIIRRGNLKLPVENCNELRGLISEYIGIANTVFDDSFGIQKRLVKGVPVFEMALGRDAISGSLFFMYDGVKHAPLSPKDIDEQKEEDVFLKKDIDHERHFIDKIDSMPSLRNSKFDDSYAIDDGDFFNTIKSLEKLGIEIRAEDKKVVLSSTVSPSVASGIDWFELDCKIEFEDAKFFLPEIIAKAKENRRFIKLGNGALGILPDKWFDQYRRLKDFSLKEKDGKLLFGKSQGMILDALLQDQNVKADKPYSDMIKSLKKYTKFKEISPSKNFLGTLRPYQKTGLSWLKSLQDISLGGCLADDMGLGKTIQVLALLQKRKYIKDKCSGTSCIIVPKSLVYNWESEIRRFTPDLDVHVHAGIEREVDEKTFKKHDIILMTYGILRRDIGCLREFPFDYAILDEAQAIKNDASHVAKASCLLNASHRLALTGTPLENHLGELFSIFKFLLPGILHKKIASYGSIKELNDTSALILKGLRPFILRRSKESVLKELPEKVESVVYCQMNAKQEREYNKVKNYYRTQLSKKIQVEGMKKSKIQILEALTRLRQVACHPKLLDPSAKSLESGKMETLTEQISTIQREGKKALVFSQFVSMLSLVRNKLDDIAISYSYLDGKTRNRQKVIEEFKSDPDISVFLISLKAGGTGLNLTEASFCFILDPWWNPAVEGQAIDRAHRIGQTNKVMAYKLISKNTVEEKILQLQNKKKKLYGDVLFDNESFLRKMTFKDMSYLFS